jgi:SAM-dependent methyltransferase
VRVWSEQVVPRLTDVMLGNEEVRRHRRRAVEGLHGVVLEIGFGSGLNLPVYPEAVERILAVDPSTVGRALAAKRIATSSIPVEFVGLDGQDLPLDDASVDAALSTFTLCTVPDPAQALGEVRRVLRPGGELHFLEHGLCPDPGVARWQHRGNAMQQRLAGGCNLDRPVDWLVRSAGFTIEVLSTGFLRGPKLSRPWGYLYEGVAKVDTRREPSGEAGTEADRFTP